MNILDDFFHILQSGFCYIHPGLCIRNILLIVLIDLGQLGLETKGSNRNNRILRRALYPLLGGHLIIPVIYSHLIPVNITLGVGKDHIIRYAHVLTSLHTGI